LQQGSVSAPITAAHCGKVDWTKAGGVLQTPGPSEEDLGVVIAESYDRFALAAVMNAIAERLAASGIVAMVRQSIRLQLRPRPGGSRASGPFRQIRA
jgi:hypothetical protein